jgi:c-di-GMP-binding flagellar brake protein YcgR
LDRGSAPPLRGDCIDLSIGGAWVEFDDVQDARLRPGGTCSIRICANSRTDGITATCKVVTTQRLEKKRIRVGFQFTNRIELYAQLDEFYARRFNRRRHVRVPSDYNVRIPVQIAWYAGSVAAVAQDISEGGIGAVLPLSKSKVLSKVKEVELAFRLPKERAEIVCRATIRSRTEFANNCLLGLEFVPEGGIEEHLPAVRKCIESRLAAFEAWNVKLSRVFARRAS